MPHPDQPEPGLPPSIEEFLGEPTRDLSRWRWLWTSDAQFPIRTHRAGLVGRLVVLFKRLVRPLVKAPQADLLDRQQAFNLVVLEYLEKLESLEATIESIRDDLVRDLTEVRTDLLRDVQNNHRRVSHLEGFKRDGFDDVMRHSDALYALVDQKLDRYRRESEDLKSRVSSLLALVESRKIEESTSEELEMRWTEQSYLALEDRFRGTNADIKERARAYLPYFDAGAEILDLGCGRGETLAVLGEKGIKARGIDSSGEMVEQCLQRGLEVRQADLMAELGRLDPTSLDGIISLHVVEHLPSAVIERLVRLSWRVLKPGGVLILETPSPLSLVVSGRNFWRDPTHRRPVHPETLQLIFEQSGFDPVERIDLRPFGVEERLPEVDLGDLPTECKNLGWQVIELRDRLDALLYGCQDYAIVGRKPATGSVDQSSAQTS